MAETILCLVQLLLGSNVPGIDQNEQAVCVRDSIVLMACLENKDP